MSRIPSQQSTAAAPERLVLALAAASLIRARVALDAGDLVELRRHTAALSSHASQLAELVEEALA